MKELEMKVGDLISHIDNGLLVEAENVLSEVIYDLKDLLDEISRKAFQEEFSVLSNELKEEISTKLIDLNRIQSQIEGVAEMIFIRDDLLNQIALNIVSLDDLEGIIL